MRYYFANIDNKSSVISLGKLLVREKAATDGEPRVYLISSSARQPEMYELAFVSKRHQLGFVEKLKSCIEQNNYKSGQLVADSSDSDDYSHEELEEGDVEEMEEEEDYLDYEGDERDQLCCQACNVSTTYTNSEEEFVVGNYPGREAAGNSLIPATEAVQAKRHQHRADQNAGDSEFELDIEQDVVEPQEEFCGAGSSAEEDETNSLAYSEAHKLSGLFSTSCSLSDPHEDQQVVVEAAGAPGAATSEAQEQPSGGKKADSSSGSEPDEALGSNEDRKSVV